jgi:hypothetical protein
VDADTRSSAPLIFAFLLGAVPLVAGCGIFLLWCATGWDWLEGAGMVNILFGILAFVIGLGCLVAHFARVAFRRPMDGRQMALGIAAGVILILNFPVCSVIIDAVFRLQGAGRLEEQLRQSSIRVINAGDSPVASATVSGLPWGGQLRSIAPGEGVSLFFDADEVHQLTVKMGDSEAGEQTADLPELGEVPLDIVAVVGADGEIKIVSMSPRYVTAD